MHTAGKAVCLSFSLPVCLSACLSVPGLSSHRQSAFPRMMGGSVGMVDVCGRLTLRDLSSFGLHPHPFLIPNPFDIPQFHSSSHRTGSQSSLPLQEKRSNNDSHQSKSSIAARVCISPLWLCLPVRLSVCLSISTSV